jgi:hypothetical protein
MMRARAAAATVTEVMMVEVQLNRVPPRQCSLLALLE